MTYLNWGCDPLTEECESCLDAFCNICNDEFKNKRGSRDEAGSLGESCQDVDEPYCDHCDLEKKPDCARCEIILAVCRNCADNKSCGFRICGKE